MKPLEFKLISSSEYLSSSIAWYDRVSFSTKMAFVSSDPDYARRQREICSGRIEKPTSSGFVARKVKWGQEASICRLSTSVVDLSQFGSERKHGNSVLGMTAWVWAEGMKIQSGKLVSFGDVQHPVVDCIEHYSSRKLVHYRLASMESSNQYLFMTITGKYIPTDLS